MGQPSLFDTPMARLSDPETSHMAAVVAIGNAATNRDRALHALRVAGFRGLTDYELEAVTGVRQVSIGVRRGELVKAGLVERQLVICPESLTLLPGRRMSGPSGSQCAVWVAV